LGTTLFLGATHLSLLKRKKIQWLAIIIPGLIGLGFFNFSLSQTNQTIDWLLKQDNLISGISILLTFEALFIVFLTIVQIKSYYAIKYPNLWKWISLIPPIQLIVAYVFLQTYLFLKVNGYSFSFLALLFFLTSSFILWLLTISIQSTIKKWENRAELQSLIALFQLLLAMFFPLMAKGQKVSFTQITIDYYAISFITVLIIVLAAIGYFTNKKKQQQSK